MSGLSFQIRWLTEPAAEDAADASFGEIGLWIDDESVWGKGSQSEDWQGIKWPLIELLEYLSRAWPLLVAQDLDPFGLIDPINLPPSMLRSELERKWRLDPSTDEDERKLATFELSHDLSRAFNGAWPPFVWLVRCGNRVIVETARCLTWFDAQEVFHKLEELGECVWKKIVAIDDPRGNAACARWRQRESLPQRRRMLQLATNLSSLEMNEIAGSFSYDEFWELDPLDHRNFGEVAAAARMAAKSLSMSSLSVVLCALKRVNRGDSHRLDAYSEIYAQQFAQHPFERPFEEGHAAAAWLRGQEGLGACLVDSESLLQRWGVQLVTVDLSEKEVDAVAAWGPKHGPVILLNSCGVHIKHKGARNVTLAHEICHLVVDRKESLPVAEVLGGSVMESVEARARAFAAEFLLPRAIAYNEFRDRHEDGQNIDTIVSALSETFLVSKEVVAWQIRNQQGDLHPKQVRALRTYVRTRHLF